MIKNAFLYRIVSPIEGHVHAELDDSLRAAIFTPCAPSQEKSVGWVPPRGHEHGALVETVAGQLILKLMTEVKKVPTQAANDKVSEKCKDIEAQTGRKPGKKEKREIQEDVRMAMLPMAFPVKRSTLIWIDPEARTLVVDAGSQSKADEAVTALVRSIDGLALQLINTQMSPAAAMALWLGTKEAPEGFTVDRECELKASDGSKAVVRYGRHALDIDEVSQHIRMGKMPTKLALTYNDRVSFVLTESLVLKKIVILDVVFESASRDSKDDQFDADVTIATGELSKLLPALIDVLGGEISVTEAQKSETEPAKTGTLEAMGEIAYEQAVELVQHHKKASISLVQRHMRIGYNAAARLLELMELRGVVSPMRSNGSRELLA